MEVKIEEATIEPDKDYCNVCGVELDISENWIVDTPLCSSCWIEDKRKEIKD